MKLHFVKVNPVQNITVFVLDQVPRDKHIDIANKLMDYGNIYAEQVGFIERSSDGNRLRLQMMGGEFCGNATRSLAALMVHNTYPGIEDKGDSYLATLEVSSIDKPLECRVRKTAKNYVYQSMVNMPLPIDIKEDSILDGEKSLEFLRVDFPGITHFIFNDKEIQDREHLYKLIKNEMDKAHYDAFGIMYFDYEEEFMIPLVYVKTTDSLFWEKSCGSGTSALGAALAYKAKTSVDKLVKQPGGDLEVSANWDNGRISQIYLDGPVEIVAEGIVNIG